ncbi:hypothetical protein LY28_00122 [Ruminiclostridium sufflavum DSM 19573]|uniref:Bacterial microcompartment domain-containing protein n=1 Tax=Ruminiclostridium sufflavum DSM 19573 TaxID=1121337 RepID=A0A318YCA5_9FIRM|nr:BMC domain-containing protein [Ruminiclostridium sufflavum]PYG90242.1 hypothetical protein LY28_00122 [Ruminiclostridium sufflavum DSM 19573]
MDNSLIIIRTVGLSNVIKTFDMVIKNTYVELMRILPEMGGGALNIILKGSLGQIEEAEILLRDMFEKKGMNYNLIVIPNFSFDIINLDLQELKIKDDL